MTFIYVIYNDKQHMVEKHDAVTAFMTASETKSMVVEMYTHKKEA